MGNYNDLIKLNAPADKVFDALTNEIPLWWTEMFEGSANNKNDTFTVRFGETIYKTILVKEITNNHCCPDKSGVKSAVTLNG